MSFLERMSLSQFPIFAVVAIIISERNGHISDARIKSLRAFHLVTTHTRTHTCTHAHTHTHTCTRTCTRTRTRTRTHIIIHTHMFTCSIGMINTSDLHCGDVTSRQCLGCCKYPPASETLNSDKRRSVDDNALVMRCSKPV